MYVISYIVFMIDIFVPLPGQLHVYNLLPTRVKIKIDL